MKLSRSTFLFVLVILLFSCSSTKITSSWKADQATAKPYRNVMVWGILPVNDSSTRRQIETHLVNDLVAKGYHAVSSMEVYASKAFKKLTDKEIIDEFRSTGVDAVITLVLLRKEKEEQYYPGGVFNQPVNNFNNLDKYSSTVYEKVFSPGYYISTTNYFWEANLFDIAENRLNYSVRTSSFEPATTEELAHKNGLIIVKDMLKKKVIPDLSPKKEQSN